MLLKTVKQPVKLKNSLELQFLDLFNLELQNNSKQIWLPSPRQILLFKSDPILCTSFQFPLNQR